MGSETKKGVNLDANIIYHIAAGGPETLVEAVSAGLRPEYLDGHAGAAMAFAVQHHAESGTVPTTADFQGMFGSDIVAQTGISPKVIVGELMKRAMFRRIQSGVAAVEGKLKANDPYGAWAEMKEQAKSAGEVSITTVQPTPLWSLGASVKENYALIKSGALGIPSPWESMNAMTMGWWPRTNSWFVARPGVGKCVDAETPVMDPVTGVYRTIRDVVETKGMVLKRDMETGEVHPVMPDAHIYTGKKETFRVTLKSGRELIATPEHPLLTSGGWRRVGELSAGDHVEVVRKTPEPMETVDPGWHTALILGAVLLDGTLPDVAPPPLVEAIMRFGEEVSGLEEAMAAVAGRFGVLGDPLCDRSIPDVVFSFPNETLAAFIGGVWLRYGDARNMTGLRLRACSRAVLDDMQRLLLRFGIISRVALVNHSDGGGSEWSLYIASTDRELFVWSFPVFSAHEGVRLVLSKRSSSVDLIQMTPEIRRAIFDRWVKSDNDVVGTGTKIAALTGSSVCRSGMTRNPRITRKRLLAFIDVTGSEDLRHLTVNHWDEIVSIEPAGVRDVYDLTVMGDHCFIANDITVHNTWLAIVSAHYAWSLRKQPDPKIVNVLVISPEMGKPAMAERFFAMNAHVGYGQVVGGTLGHFAEQQFHQSLDDMSDETGIWIMDQTDGLTPERIEQAIDAVEADLVVIDSVYKIKWKERARDRFENMYEGVDTISSWSKRVWRDGREIAIIAASQMNRDGTKKGGSQQSSVALADNLSWEADNLFFLEQTDDMKADKRLRLITGKCRRMADYKQSMLLQWDMDTMEFDEVPEVQKAKPKFSDPGFGESPF